MPPIPNQKVKVKGVILYILWVSVQMIVQNGKV